jgi:GT2 family glycosyltransferase
VSSTLSVAAPSLQIQTVFYNISPGSVDRFLSSVAQASKLAKAAGSIGRVSLAIGDCSPLRTFRLDGIATLEASLLDAGIDDFTYDFFDENLGSADGHNRLFNRLTSDLVLILNPDIVASPYLIQELTLRLNDSSIGLVEGRQIPIEHPKDYDVFSGQTSWATTACALIPRQVVATVGPFDSASFFLYCDDVDYSWRIRLAGYKVIFHPPARIFHDKRLRADAGLVVGAAEEYYAAEAALLMAHKWSRPDLVTEFLTTLEGGGTELQRKAAAAFRKRRSCGDLPSPVDPDHKVGQFHGNNWARHRW